MAPTKRTLFPHHPLSSKPHPDLCASACNPTQNFFRFCPPLCVPLCPAFCQTIPDFLHSPQPPPSVHTTGTDYQPHHHHDYLSPVFITMVILLASSFVLAVSYLIYFAFSSSSLQLPVRRQRSSRRVMEYDQSMDVLNFHPVWYIATVGLQRSAIDSIAVCTYKKGDGLVLEVTCPICLAEFQERDALRLLPKCCHAFHVPCIDTWLESHTNCPVCRASVLQENTNPQPRDARVVEIAQDPSSSREVSGEDGGEFEGVEGEEGEAWRPRRRAASMDSLCVELGEKVDTCSSGVNSLGERSLSCTGKLFSSSRNGFR